MEEHDPVQPAQVESTREELSQTRTVSQGVDIIPCTTTGGTAQEQGNILESNVEEEADRPDDAQATPEVQRNFVLAYLIRLKGAGQTAPPLLALTWDAIPSFLFATITLLILVVIEQFGLRPHNKDLYSFLPSFAASCALVMCRLTSAGAQPRSIILTHLAGGFLGISWSHITNNLPEPLSQQLASAFAVAILNPLMLLAGASQPSAAATTCLAAFHEYGKMNDQGFMFLVAPALLGSCVIVFMGWLLNNLIPWRHCYPLWL